MGSSMWRSWGCGGSSGDSRKVLGDVASSLGGGAEESRAGGPPHLQGGGDHYHGFGRFCFGGVFGEHTAELAFVSFGDDHPPEAIFDVEFAEENGFGVS